MATVDTTLDEPDSGVVAAIGRGDEQALGRLYDRYSRPCFALAVRVLSSEQDAEEAVQETFVRVWRSAVQYDVERAAVSSWLLSITRNLCIDELRRRRRRSLETPSLDDAPEPPATDRTDLEVERTLMSQEIRQSLQSLPSEQRAAIELVYFYGLSSQEVGRLLDVPAPTVRSRLRLGLLKLGGILKERGVSVDE